jgi:hypothetical protein
MQDARFALFQTAQNFRFGGRLMADLDLAKPRLAALNDENFPLIDEKVKWK